MLDCDISLWKYSITFIGVEDFGLVAQPYLLPCILCMNANIQYMNI